jgi:hypothetical protein
MHADCVCRYSRKGRESILAWRVYLCNHAMQCPTICSVYIYWLSYACSIVEDEDQLDPITSEELCQQGVTPGHLTQDGCIATLPHAHRGTDGALWTGCEELSHEFQTRQQISAEICCACECMGEYVLTWCQVLCNEQELQLTLSM